MVTDQSATGVDVALWGRLKNRRRAVVLTEVKLSEGNFTHCGGRKSRRNRRRDVCESAKLFLDEPKGCRGGSLTAWFPPEEADANE